MKNTVDYPKFLKASPEERLKMVNTILKEIKLEEISKTVTLLHGATMLKLADAIDVAIKEFAGFGYGSAEWEKRNLLIDLALVLRKNTVVVTRAKSKLKIMGYKNSAGKVVQELGIPKMVVDEFITELEQRKPNPLGYYSGGYQAVFFTDAQVQELKNRFPKFKANEDDSVITLTINMSKNTLFEMLKKGQPIILNLGITENVATHERQLSFLAARLDDLDTIDYSVRTHNLLKSKHINYVWEIAEFGGSLTKKAKAEVAKSFSEYGLNVFSVPTGLINKAKELINN